MSDPYSELKKIFESVENEYKIPNGLIKTIYDLEKDYVQYALRDPLHSKIQKVLEEAGLKDTIEEPENDKELS